PRPRWRASASIAFARFDEGVAAARALAQSGLSPANARLLDPNEARLHRVRFDGTAVLLIGFESADHPMWPWLARRRRTTRRGPVRPARGGRRSSMRRIYSPHCCRSA